MNESVEHETTTSLPEQLLSPHQQIAFVQDNFVQAGGGERVAEEIARALPTAEVYASVLVEQRLSKYMKTRTIHTSWMQHLPNLRKYYRHYFLLYPLAMRGFDLKKYDLVVSSCYGFAKMLNKRPDALHVCYCHSPSRWIWRYEDYARRENFNVFVNFFLRNLTKLLRNLDKQAADRVDVFIANSTVIAERIRLYYGRDSEIMFPPIDVQRFSISADIGDYYLIVSRLVGYKRVDLAIEACKLLGRKLIIVGEGPDRPRLEALAGPETKFAGRLPDEDVTHLLSHCRAFLFPGEEDFGLTPLEAAASGRPCVAYGVGGALDTIVDGQTGILFPDATPVSMADALVRSEAISWDPQKLRKHAEKFDRTLFSQRLVQRLTILLQQRDAKKDTRL